MDTITYALSVKETLTKVKAFIKEGKTWKGYFAGNNVNHLQIWQGWHLGYYVEISTLEELLELRTQFLFQLEKELGSYIVYYHTGKHISR